MTQKKIQKAFYLSSEYAKEFIETRIDDIAVKTQHSSSYIIETLLLKSLLPENEEAKDIIRYNLYPQDGQGGVQRTLEAIFSKNAAGTGWEPRHNNFFPLIEFCLNFGTYSATYKGKQTSLDHFYSQMRSIVEYVQNCANSCIEEYDRQRYESLAAWAGQLYEKAQSEPNEIVIRYHFELVRDCWAMLSNYDITYRYLRDLVMMGEFQESTIARNELYDIINEISEEW